MIYEDIISAVDIHRKAMELVVIRIFIVHIMLAVNKRKIANMYSFFYVADISYKSNRN
jgi:hypothetical protein